MEKAVVFQNGPETLRGILHEGGDPNDAGCGRERPGVVFCHGWSGCRLGPHDMFVKMARRLAEQGFWSLRFDFRGRGESEGDTAATNIAGMTSDAQAATAFMSDAVGVKSIALVGICSGGKVAIGAAVQNPLVRRLVLWSCEPMGDLRTTAVETRKRVAILREYGRKLMRLETWKKILTGRVNTNQVKKAVVRREETPDDLEIKAERAIMEKFKSFAGDVLLVHGTNDPDTALAASRYVDLCRREGMAVESLAIQGANHSFYSVEWEREVMDHTQKWLMRADGA